MGKLLGNKKADAVRLPCTPPAADDILTVDATDPTVGVYKKADTSNIADSAITTQKVADGAISTVKVADGAVSAVKVGAGAIDDSKIAAGRTLVASGAVDGSKNLDFNAGSGWVNKNLDGLDDGTTWKKVAGVDATNKATGTSIANGAVSDSHVASGAAIAGSKLSAGSGALANLDNTGKLDFAATHTNKHLDSIADGTTYKRVASVNATGKCTTSSYSASTGEQITGDRIAPNTIDHNSIIINSLTATEIAPLAVGTSELGLMAVTSANLANFLSHQLSATTSNAVATYTTTTPAEDDTPPLTTEGTQLMSFSHSLIDAAAEIISIAVAYIANSADAARQNGAIFDTTSSVLVGAFSQDLAGNAKPEMCICTGTRSPGTTASHTYAFRVGTSGGTSTFNGSGGTRRFSTSTKSMIINHASV